MTEEEQKQLVEALVRADSAERTLKAVLELVKVNAPELYKAMGIDENTLSPKTVANNQAVRQSREKYRNVKLKDFLE